MSELPPIRLDPVLPDEYESQLTGLEPTSEEYAETRALLLVLYSEEQTRASHRGEAAITHATDGDIAERPKIAEEDSAVPQGYKSAKTLKKAGRIGAEQFKGKIYSFAERTSTDEVDITELETENGIKVRICDLRPNMTAKVRKGGPAGKSIKKILDRNFFHDVKKHAELFSPDHPETAPGGKNVIAAPGVRYSSIAGAQVRSYWMVVRDENAPDKMTIARLADSADGGNFERDLYRRMFNVTMQKK